MTFSMRESAPIDTTLMQPFSVSWGRGPKYSNGNMEDIEPLSRAPAPSACHNPHSLTLDPLLTVTPEKSLGLAVLSKRKSAEGVKKTGEGTRQSRPRVRFAPGTITSPPSSQPVTGDSTAASPLTADHKSMPRNAYAIANRLYQPGMYSEDGLCSKALGPSELSSGAGAPKQRTVEKNGNDTVSMPVDSTTRSIMSSYGDTHFGGKTVKPTVLRHTSDNNLDIDSAGPDADIKRVFRHMSPSRSRSKENATCSAGGSRQSSQHASLTTSSLSARQKCSTLISPSRQRPSSSSPTCLNSSSGSRSPSPTQSPDKRHPGSCRSSFDGDVQLLSDDEVDTPAGVKVIREAPMRPKIHDYVFPFSAADQDTGYNSYFENPLARPEFNSALKINQELRNAKAKKPDAWGAVTETLNKNQQKRTQIQEKASSKVNFQMQSGQYSGLIDLDLPIDQICNSVESEITQKAPVIFLAPAKVPVGKKPDIMEFFSDDLQRELPDLSLTGIPSIAEELTRADPILAFDLYRHNRCWDGLSDS